MLQAATAFFSPSSRIVQNKQNLESCSTLVNTHEDIFIYKYMSRTVYRNDLSWFWTWLQWSPKLQRAQKFLRRGVGKSYLHTFCHGPSLRTVSRAPALWVTIPLFKPQLHSENRNSQLAKASWPFHLTWHDRSGQNREHTGSVTRQLLPFIAQMKISQSHRSHPECLERQIKPKSGEATCLQLATKHQDQLPK